MKAKKSSKARRKERRLAEIARAQAAANRTVVAQTVTSEAEKIQVKQNKLGYHELPMKEIRKDLIKNAAFMIFAVALIIGIKITGVGYFNIPF